MWLGADESGFKTAWVCSTVIIIDHVLFQLRVRERVRERERDGWRLELSASRGKRASSKTWMEFRGTE